MSARGTVRHDVLRAYHDVLVGRYGWQEGTSAHQVTSERMAHVIGARTAEPYPVRCFGFPMFTSPSGERRHVVRDRVAVCERKVGGKWVKVSGRDNSFAHALSMLKGAGERYDERHAVVNS